MLEQDTQADGDQHQTAGEFRGFAQPDANPLADQGRQERQHQGDQPDDQDRLEDRNLQHRERNPHRRRIDAGRKAKHQQAPDPDPVDVLAVVRVLEAVPDHLCADRAQQPEGYPVIDWHDEPGEPGGEQPTGQRHHRLEAGKGDRNPQRLQQAQGAGSQPAGQGRGEGIGRYAEADKKHRPQGHAFTFPRAHRRPQTMTGPGSEDPYAKKQIL